MLTLYFLIQNRIITPNEAEIGTASNRPEKPKIDPKNDKENNNQTGCRPIEFPTIFGVR